MESHPGVIEANTGGVESNPGAVAVLNGAMETHHGAVRPILVLEANPIPMKANFGE